MCHQINVRLILNYSTMKYTQSRQSEKTDVFSFLIFENFPTIIFLSVHIVSIFLNKNATIISYVATHNSDTFFRSYHLSKKLYHNNHPQLFPTDNYMNVFKNVLMFLIFERNISFVDVYDSSTSTPL